MKLEVAEIVLPPIATKGTGKVYKDTPIPKPAPKGKDKRGK